MHKVQQDVAEFHRVVVGVPDGETPAIRRPALRAALIREEARETIEAIEADDLVEAIDGMCDLLCVIYGAALEFGVDLEPFWDEVHQTNMAKAGGPVRQDGKRLKPDGWRPPQIQRILRGECPAYYYPEPGHRAGAPYCNLPYGHEGKHRVVYPNEVFVWQDAEREAMA